MNVDTILKRFEWKLFDLAKFYYSRNFEENPIFVTKVFVT